MTHQEIVWKLIGEIHPVAESNEDARRLENLKAMCELVDNLVHSITNVVIVSNGRQEASVRKIADYAENFLNKDLGIKIEY